MSKKVMDKTGRMRRVDSVSGLPTKEYKDNFDAIFGKKSSTSSAGKKGPLELPDDFYKPISDEPTGVLVGASKQKCRQDARG